MNLLFLLFLLQISLSICIKSSLSLLKQTFHISDNHCLPNDVPVLNLSQVHHLKQPLLQNGTKQIGVTFIVGTSPLQSPLFLIYYSSTVYSFICMHVLKGICWKKYTWNYVMPGQYQVKLALFECCSSQDFCSSLKTCTSLLGSVLSQSQSRLEQVSSSKPWGGHVRPAGCSSQRKQKCPYMKIHV